MFGFDMKYCSSVLPEMCLGLQFDKTSENFSGWPVTVLFNFILKISLGLPVTWKILY